MVECAQKLNLGTDMDKLRETFSDPNHPNEVCARLCIYQAMELVDDNFDIIVSISDPLIHNLLQYSQKYPPETEIRNASKAIWTYN